MRVPQYEQQVETGALPNARLNVDSRGAFGEQVAVGARNLVQGGVDAAQTYRKIQEQDDNAIIKNSMSELRREVNAKQYLDEDAYFSRAGQTAYQTLPDQMKSLDELRKLHAEKLTPRQQNKFSLVSQEYLDREHEQMSRHAQKERRVWLDAEDDGVIESAQEDGSLRWTDNAAYEKQIIASIRNKSIRNGWAPEQTDNEIKKATTVLHVTALENIMQQQPGRARDYFDQHKNEILAKYHDDLLAKMETQTNDQAAMVAADSATALDTEAQAREWLTQNVPDAKVRKAAIALVSDEYRAREREKNRVALESYGTAVDHVLGGGSAAQWAMENADQWNLIDPDKQRALMNGFDVQTDVKTYYETKGYIVAGKMDQAYENLVGGKINNTDAKKLVDQMLKAPTKQRNVLTDKSAFDKSIQAILRKRPTGKKSGEDWDKKYNFWMGMYQEQIDQWHDANPTKKIMPAEDRQKILDSMTIEATLA